MKRDGSDGEIKGRAKGTKGGEEDKRKGTAIAEESR